MCKYSNSKNKSCFAMTGGRRREGTSCSGGDVGAGLQSATQPRRDKEVAHCSWNGNDGVDSRTSCTPTNLILAPSEIFNIYIPGAKACLSPSSFGNFHIYSLISTSRVCTVDGVVKKLELRVREIATEIFEVIYFSYNSWDVVLFLEQIWKKIGNSSSKLKLLNN